MFVEVQVMYHGTYDDGPSGEAAGLLERRLEKMMEDIAQGIQWDFEAKLTKALESLAHRQLGPAMQDVAIPLVYRTRGITYAECARYHSGKKYANPSVYVKKQIKNRLLTAPIGEGRLKQYDIRQFPPGFHPELRDPAMCRTANKTSAS